jgi:hypothetical protein
MPKYGPSIVTDSLQVLLDSQNIDSFPGEPTTNLTEDPLMEDGVLGNYYDRVNSGWGTTTRLKFEDVMGPFGNTVRAFTQELIVGGVHGEGGQYEIPGGATNNFTLTSGVEYTISVYAKSSIKRTSQTNHIYILGASGNQSDVARTVNTEWTRLERVFTPTTTGVHYIRSYMYNSVVGQKVYYTGLQVEQKGHATPFVKTARAEALGWKNLVSSSYDADLDNMTDASYDSDGINFANAGFVELNYDCSNLATRDHSIAFWFKTTTYAIVLNTYYGTPKIQFRFSGDSLQYNIRGSNGATVPDLYATATSVADGTWHYATGVRDGDDIKIYIDGVLRDTTSGATSINTDSGRATFPIGATGPYHADYAASYTGKLDAFKIYHKALTVDEILQNFHALKGRYLAAA